MLWLLSGTPGFTCWIFFSSGIQFYFLLSPYLCFIYFLYLDLYVLGDIALISQGSFLQTKHLCVLIRIWTKGEVGAPLNRSKPSRKIFLLTVPRRCFFCASFVLFLSCFVVLSRTSVCWCLVVTCWEGADLLALVWDVWLWRCHFPIGVLGRVWCLNVSIHNLALFLTLLFDILEKTTNTSFLGTHLHYDKNRTNIYFYCLKLVLARKSYADPEGGLGVRTPPPPGKLQK